MRTLTMALLAALMFVSLPAFAQSNNTATQEQNNVFSGDQQREAQAQLRALGVAFGVTPAEQPKPEPQAEKPAEQPKTVADVADKALDMAAGFVTSVSKKMEEVAPTIWRVMIKQQYAKAIGEVIVPVGLVLAIIVFIIFARYTAKKRYANDCDEQFRVFEDGGGMTDYGVSWIFTTLIPSIVLVCVSVWMFNRLSTSIMYVINPEYYAVKDLLQMLLAPGSAAQ